MDPEFQYPEKWTDEYGMTWDLRGTGFDHGVERVFFTNDLGAVLSYQADHFQRKYLSEQQQK